MKNQRRRIETENFNKKVKWVLGNLCSNWKSLYNKHVSCQKVPWLISQWHISEPNIFKVHDHQAVFNTTTQNVEWIRKDIFERKKVTAECQKNWQMRIGGDKAQTRKWNELWKIWAIKESIKWPILAISNQWINQRV